MVKNQYLPSFRKKGSPKNKLQDNYINFAGKGRFIIHYINDKIKYFLFLEAFNEQSELFLGEKELKAQKTRKIHITV